jgi:hypothetical protein
MTKGASNETYQLLKGMLKEKQTSMSQCPKCSKFGISGPDWNIKTA